MLTVVCPNPTFEAPARITVPGQEALGEFVGVWKYKGRKALKAFIQGLGEMSDIEAIGEVLIGWREVDVPFSAEALQTVLDNYPASPEELLQAYFIGLQESRLKNSKTSLLPGPGAATSEATTS